MSKEIEQAKRKYLAGRETLVKRIEQLRKMPENEHIVLHPEDMIEFLQCIVDLGDIATEDVAREKA